MNRKKKEEQLKERKKHQIVFYLHANTFITVDSMLIQINWSRFAYCIRFELTMRTHTHTHKNRLHKSANNKNQNYNDTVCQAMAD